MRKFLSLLLVPFFSILLFLGSVSPVYACSYVPNTTFIAPSSPVEVTITGNSGAFFDVTILEASGSNVVSGPVSGAINSGGSTTTITIPSPADEGSYRIQVKEVSFGGGGGFCDPIITVLNVRGDAPSVADTNAPAEIGAIVKVIENIIKLLVPVAAIAFFIMFIVGGVQFLMSGGDPKAAAGARNTLTYAIIGIILVVVSWLILLVVKNVTGVDVTNVSF